MNSMPHGYGSARIIRIKKIYASLIFALEPWIFFCSNRFVVFTNIKFMKSEQVVKALGALAQPTRLAIYRLLVEAGQAGMIAGQIAERLNAAPATLSFHFKTLSHAGLIESRQDGRFIFYSANFAAMNGMLDYLTENCCGGNMDACKPPARKN